MASIRKIEGKRGLSYKITVTQGLDCNGRQIRRYMTWKPEPGMTARQAEKAVQKAAYDFEHKLEIGYRPDNKQTFSEYAKYVFSVREMRGNKPLTMARVGLMTERINEYIGNLKLVDIRPQHLMAMYKKMLSPGGNRWGLYAAAEVDFLPVLDGTSATKFANSCGVSPTVICKLLRGQNISKASAKKIEAYTGRNDLFTYIGGDRGIAPTTLHSYHAVVYSVLQQAEREMIVPYNAAEKVQLPSNKRLKPIKAIQPDELTGIFKALEQEPTQFRTMINLLIVTGVRRGELLAIKWDKVNFEKRTITIDRSIQQLPRIGAVEGPTKTDNTRDIMIPAGTMNLLRQQRIAQLEERFKCGDLWRDTGYIFTTWDGGPVSPCEVNRLLSEFCKRHGLRHIHPHEFRHTVASILIAGGVDIVTVSKMLGHSNTTTTLETYAHEIETARAAAADCIADVIMHTKAENR